MYYHEKSLVLCKLDYSSGIIVIEMVLVIELTRILNHTVMQTLIRYLAFIDRLNQRDDLISRAHYVSATLAPRFLFRRLITLYHNRSLMPQNLADHRQFIENMIIFVIVRTNCYQSQQSKNLMEIPWIIGSFSINLLATLLTGYVPKRSLIQHCSERVRQHIQHFSDHHDERSPYDLAWEELHHRYKANPKPV